jgi:redox-regulated HSP33 family molecular chaperone
MNHTDGGKKFTNKIASELYHKLDIKGTHTAPAHLQCTCQAEVFNKKVAKFMKNVVDESTLNWEWYILPFQLLFQDKVITI